MDKNAAQDELLEKIKTALTAHPSASEFARHLGVNPGMVYHVLNGGWSPSLARKMGVKVTQVDRMAARLTPEEGQRAREWLRRQGFDNVTDYWQHIISS